MVDLEQLSEFRFYKLEAVFPDRCTNEVDNIYSKVNSSENKTKICGGQLVLQMANNSVNMRCPHVGCRREYDITRKCNTCEHVTLFEDSTCDNCEPRVINIATWKCSIAEANKAIKKVNRAFKQNLIDEKEWKTVLQINQDEVERCQKLLENL